MGVFLHDLEASVGTFNARGLLHCKRAIRAIKNKYFYKLLKKLDVLCLQEMHGDEFMLKAALPDLHRSHYIATNPGKGGTCILVSKRWLQCSDAMIKHTVIKGAEGRVQRLSTLRKGIQWNMWNIHNFELTEDTMTRIQRAALANIAATRQAPPQQLLLLCR